MLAFILLVVLGGGLGLLAVSLAESPKPATDGGSPRRAPDPDERSPDPLDDTVEDGPQEGEELVEVVVGDPDGDLVATVPAPVEASPDVGPAAVIPAPEAGPVEQARRRPDVRSVPRAYTAIEGRYDAVAVAPVWRRLLSLCALVLIAVATGVGLAAVAAAIFGALAELLNAAVG